MPTGIRLRRDSLVSVRYAEERNSTTSSVTLQRTDRHGILGEKVDTVVKILVHVSPLRALCNA